MAYQSVSQGEMQHSNSHKCSIRSDHSGLKGFCKSWYLFVVHLVASILVTFGIMKIDGYKFQIGSPPTLLSFDSSLYQVQVTGLLSLALVIVRVIGGSCSALLAWRTTFVLLEKRGISLAEMIRVNNWRFPILPAMTSETSVLWSVGMGDFYNFVAMAAELCGTIRLPIFVLDPRDAIASGFH